MRFRVQLTGIPQPRFFTADNQTDAELDAARVYGGLVESVTPDDTGWTVRDELLYAAGLTRG